MIKELGLGIFEVGSKKFLNLNSRFQEFLTSKTQGSKKSRASDFKTSM